VCRGAGRLMCGRGSAVVCSDGDGEAHDGDLAVRHGNGSQQQLDASA
jgi:hypothetical protein